MKHDVWPDASIRDAVTASYVPVFVDVDAAGNREVLRRYGISSIPSIVVVDGEGKETKQSGFMTRDALLAFLSNKPM
jgi:thiol:disulfide interchange protein